MKKHIINFRIDDILYRSIIKEIAKNDKVKDVSGFVRNLLLDYFNDLSIEYNVHEFVHNIKGIKNIDYLYDYQREVLSNIDKVIRNPDVDSLLTMMCRQHGATTLIEFGAIYASIVLSKNVYILAVNHYQRKSILQDIKTIIQNLPIQYKSEYTVVDQDAIQLNNGTVIRTVGTLSDVTLLSKESVVFIDCIDFRKDTQLIEHVLRNYTAIAFGNHYTEPLIEALNRVQFNTVLEYPWYCNPKYTQHKKLEMINMIGIDNFIKECCIGDEAYLDKPH